MEILTALQQSESLLVKLTNYKANGQEFQCLFALHPIFGPAPDTEYKFQIGIQLDFQNADPDLGRKLAEFGKIYIYIYSRYYTNNLIYILICIYPYEKKSVG
jgi:hypothetical protein